MSLDRYPACSEFKSNRSPFFLITGYGYAADAAEGAAKAAADAADASKAVTPEALSTETAGEAVDMSEAVTVEAEKVADTTMAASSRKRRASYSTEERSKRWCSWVSKNNYFRKLCQDIAIACFCQTIDFY